MNNNGHEKAPLRVAVVGASGYSGGELLRLLVGAADVRVDVATANAQAGRAVADVHPLLAGRCDLALTAFDAAALAGLDCVFIALPSGEAMQLAPSLLDTVGCVIDLGGDLRLPTAALYEQYYRKPHAAPRLLGEAVYGLPELNRARIRGAKLIANPGCYPTGAILALLPALKAGLVKPAGIVINSLSGTSGAGRSATAELSFSEMDGNARAYRIGDHQHIPEIAGALSQAAGCAVTVSFVPHLAPLVRGIHTTVHADLARTATTAEVQALYADFYRDEPFVRACASPAAVRDVVGTNRCDVAAFVEPHVRKLVVTSVIDNLLKGAAGQAVQNLNLAFGRPERALLP